MAISKNGDQQERTSSLYPLNLPCDDHLRTLEDDMTDSNGPILIHLPILPLKRTVLFPGTMMPLTVGRERSIAAVEAALKTEDKTLLVVAHRDAQIDQP